MPIGALPEEEIQNRNEVYAGKLLTWPNASQEDFAEDLNVANDATADVVAHISNPWLRVFFLNSGHPTATPIAALTTTAYGVGGAKNVKVSANRQ